MNVTSPTPPPHPTPKLHQIFASVPRLWNRIYDRVMLAVQTGSPLARGLFERAYAHKRACLAKGDPVGGRWGRLYDRLVFSKIRAKLGGELKYMISGEVGGFGGLKSGVWGLGGVSCVFGGLGKHLGQACGCWCR